MFINPLERFSVQVEFIRLVAPNEFGDYGFLRNQNNIDFQDSCYNGTISNWLKSSLIPTQKYKLPYR
ncbi:MAG: hypothetical protein DWQ02_17595 [Bacteroidetes bacterium]|nr:MAG: hypothetical protein DWQ02_17595 [Bacteroidota bacterium]